MSVHYFFDASALIKQFISEPGSTRIEALFAFATRSRMHCSWLGVLEAVSIIGRKKNDGRLTREAAEAAITEFIETVLEKREFGLHSLSEELFRAALPLIRRHNLNASDALILQSALQYSRALTPPEGPLVFCAADQRLVRAARAEGLTAFDPEMDELPATQPSPEQPKP